MGMLDAINERKYALLLCFLLFILGAGVAVYLIPKEVAQLNWETPGLLSQYPFVQQLRPILIGLACFLPALGALLYSMGRILDRYVAKSLFSTFGMTTSIIFLIWLLADFSDNVSDITGMESPLRGMLSFYLNQIPMVLSLIVPYSMLLATLWTLSTLSRNCEITPMLQSGRSLLRVTTPLIIIALFATLYTTIFNYQWAPSATMYRRMTFNQLDRERAAKRGDAPNPIVYKNDIDNRIWSIRYFPRMDDPTAPFYDVHLEQFSSLGKLHREYFAESAQWSPKTRSWTLRNTLIRNHPEGSDGIPEFENTTPSEVILPYRETPWLLITPSVRTDTRGVADLITRLEEDRMNEKVRREFRTHKYLRFAQGMSCLILALLAIPNGITFSRRGGLAGVGSALALSGCMIFSFEVFPSLSAAGYLTPFLGAFLPDIIFLLIAFYLFFTKLAQKKFSDLFFWKKR